MSLTGAAETIAVIRHATLRKPGYRNDRTWRRPLTEDGAPPTRESRPLTERLLGRARFLCGGGQRGQNISQSGVIYRGRTRLFRLSFRERKKVVGVKIANPNPNLNAG